MKLKKETSTLVRIDKKLVARVAKNRDKTGVPIGKFFELAAEEKLKKIK
jgi:hypothetical protein